MDAKGKSLELLYQAYDLPISEGKKLIKKALVLDSENVDAYNYLADIEADTYKALDLYKKAMEIGEKTLGKEAFINYEGIFWGVSKTRPFMRAKAGVADCLHAIGKIDEAIKQYQEMLKLNPNDNQGVRNLLSTFLLIEKRYNEYEQLFEEYKENSTAVWVFNYALYKYAKEGKNDSSEKALIKANKTNGFVIDYMLGLKKMPKKLPALVGYGNEDEAITCVNDSKELWEKTNGALDWLVGFKYEIN